MKTCQSKWVLIVFFLSIFLFGGNCGQKDSLGRVDIVAIKHLPPEVQLDSLCEWIYSNESSNDTALSFFLVRQAEKLLPDIKDRNLIGCFFKRKGSLFAKKEMVIPAITLYSLSLDEYTKSGNLKEQAGIYCRIGTLYRSLGLYRGSGEYYFKAQKLYTKIGAEPLTVIPLLGRMNYYLVSGKLDSAKIMVDRANLVASKTYNADKMGELWNAYALYFLKSRDWDSAFFYLNKASDFYESSDPLNTSRINNNIGALLLDKGDYDSALVQFRHSYELGSQIGDASLVSDAASNFSKAFIALDKYDSASKYFQIKIQEDSSLAHSHNLEVESLMDSLKSLRIKEKQNVRLEEVARKNMVVIWAISISLGLLSVIAYLIVRQLRRSKRIALLNAENQRLADAQRIVDLMQEMDIRTLESKIEGVNEERDRLAIELHDGLGSTLASIKLYFSQLEGAAPEKVALFDKANRLLDDACQSLRDYAHNLAGNKEVAGGLALVVQNLAATVSGAGSMKVQVFAHDIPLNLPPEFSRSLYKIVQELLTNAIRHSNAKHMTIQFTRHAGHLNLLVEDDGVGFSPQILSDGMGLGNVRQRVTVLGGEIAIDSMPGRGATFLIDIPIAAYDTH